MPAVKKGEKGEAKTEDEVGSPVVVRPEAEKVLLEWKAPIRLYKKRTNQFWTTAFTMAFLVGLIMFFIEGWVPVAVIIAFVFLVYVMSSVPPEEIDHQVTTQGIWLGESKYLWGEMIRFWLSEKWGHRLVNIALRRMPGRLVFLLGPVREEALKEELSKYLPFEEMKPSWIERVSAWAGKKIPFEVE